MRLIAAPPTPVMPVIGRCFQRVDGSRQIEYTDTAGNVFVCVIDGVVRSWYEAEPKAQKQK